MSVLSGSASVVVVVVDDDSLFIFAPIVCRVLCLVLVCYHLAGE